MDARRGLAELTLSPLAEIFLFNRSDRLIRIGGDGLGPPFIVQPGEWESRQVHRGITLRIATWDLGRHGFELWTGGLWGAPISRRELTIPLEAGNSILWGWDGLAWQPLK